MAEKKSDFVVQDRRRFTDEGELNQEAAKTEEPATPAPQMPAEESAPSYASQQDTREMPPPPTAAEQYEQHGHYQSASKTIDEILDKAGAKRPKNFEATFEGLVLSLYMQAMVQLGMPLREGDPPQQPDVIGARHTIDMISLLADKTKGNLTERESTVLQNSLFELRMTFVELTKAITTAPPPQKK
ncbi:MAG TPA: DUF1844 domain-containing protein [Terriglobales bacterium]|nr:DUF1844 domain-containing protein [Terriglobales bacterium]